MALRGALAAAVAANGSLTYLRLVGLGRPDRVRLQEVGVCVATAADVRRAATGGEDGTTGGDDGTAAAGAAAAGVVATRSDGVVRSVDAEGGLPITVGVGTPWNVGHHQDGAEPWWRARLSPFMCYVREVSSGGEEEVAMGR